MNQPSPHKFHIPVMGLAYTIDSPVKVARFGIASVISIVEDQLIEMMRSYYYPTIQQVYYPINTNEEDYRAKRITDYLNLLNKIVQQQVEKLKKSAFEAGSEIVKYFEMLSDDSNIKKLYRYVMNSDNNPEKENIESFLRTQIIPGSIDVNIMTKIDRNTYDKNGELLNDGSDAVSALRAFTKSDLSNSSVIFSAGMNPRLYNYLEKCNEFDANDDGKFRKKIVIKVSDYRSAIIQGKYLAKKGIWVSEFRIESGLNCGGHAFATDGYLMGPILEEFKSRKKELITSVFEIYNQAIKAKGHKGFSDPHPIKITAQGGIGTFEEDHFLHTYYGLESTGWGTPFLLVPEATTVDEATLNLLCEAKKEDVVLSNNSPLGVRFHYLKRTSSDLEKHSRINKGKPGSPCTEKYLGFNTEFTEKPICTASRKYQKLKIAQLQSQNLPDNEYQNQLTDVMDKECLCIGLSNAASKVYKVPFVKNLNAVTICPGPNIAYFSKIVTLQTMTDHIYGRTNIIEDIQRPHMFIAELRLYINYLQEQLAMDSGKDPDRKRTKYYDDFYNNLMNGINYYRNLPGVAMTNREQFNRSLDEAELELNQMNFQLNNIKQCIMAAH
jgi:hypothetical protein